MAKTLYELREAVEKTGKALTKAGARYAKASDAIDRAEERHGNAQLSLEKAIRDSQAKEG